jgi:predicted nicotinamide N-methyase
VERNLHKTLPDARIDINAIPNLMGMRLMLINSDYQTGPLAPEVMAAAIAEPAYWAFCWGSGLATARWLLENPDIVHNQVVVDLGSGSGVVAVAASLAGAKTVFACDIDPMAQDATTANAQINTVEVIVIESLTCLPIKADVLLMADVLYDRSNFVLIQTAKLHTTSMIIADSRIVNVEDSEFTRTHRMEALTQPNLGEFEKFRTVSFFNWRR